MPAGRPTVYKDTYPDELISLMKQGWLDVQVYAEWDISKDTFYRWLREKPELQEAYDRGFAKCEAYYIRKAQEAMDNHDDKGFKYYISLMNNKFGWEKGSKASENSTTININNMNVLQNKSRDDLLTYIKDKIIKNNDIIDVQLLEADRSNESE